MRVKIEGLQPRVSNRSYEFSKSFKSRKSMYPHTVKVVFWCLRCRLNELLKTFIVQDSTWGEPNFVRLRLTRDTVGVRAKWFGVTVFAKLFVSGGRQVEGFRGWRFRYGR